MFIRPVPDTFKRYLDTDSFKIPQKKYLDTDTLKILSEKVSRYIYF